jgi:release factor glutamine methyltransferase
LKSLSSLGTSASLRAVTILEVINKTTPYLEKNGIESPRLTIELLLAHVLQKKRLQLYLEFERDLDNGTLDKLRDLVKRRVAGEPIQYITGEAEFHGLKFTVDCRVLIPRPETELLVEAVAKREPKSVIDIGTGSGCIAITLAKKLPACDVTAADTSADALAVAQANATRHEAGKIRLIQADLLPGDVRVEAIVSNPPYIALGDLAGLPREVREFEPHGALIAGADGLEIYRRLAPLCRQALLPGGFVALEVGAGQAPAVAELLTAAGLAVEEVIKDLQGHERVVVARCGIASGAAA